VALELSTQQYLQSALLHNWWWNCHSTLRFVFSMGPRKSNICFKARKTSKNQHASLEWDWKGESKANNPGRI